jgi:hypothetical protein
MEAFPGSAALCEGGPAMQIYVRILFLTSVISIIQLHYILLNSNRRS